MTLDRPASRKAPPQRDPLAAVRARLTSYIAERGLKKSRQRDVIAEAFFGAAGHLSAEELVTRARSIDGRVSVATVYRTLKLLGESGLAVPRHFEEGQTRWESAVGRHHHDHLICNVCGRILEFADDDIEALQAAVARRHGFEVQSHRLELYGRCADCRRRALAEGRGGGEARR
jgi:Fur family transcriptional regulator, ferric uptake regulator